MKFHSGRLSAATQIEARVIPEVHLEYIFLLFLFGFNSSSATESVAKTTPAMQTQCSDEIVRNVGKHFHLDYFSPPINGFYPSVENGGLIYSSTCKAFPNNKSIIISAFAYDAGIESEKELLVALLDASNNKVLNSYKEAISEDAVTQINENSLTLDTAKYSLSENTRAFGVRINGFLDRCGYEGGYDDQLILFIVNGNKLKPILSETMSHWRYTSENRCNGEDPPKIYANTIISIEKTSSHGFSDLRISAISNSKLKPPSIVIKFNGHAYDMTPWQHEFDSWWDKAFAKHGELSP